MTSGIGSWGVYLPYWRLEREAIAQALGGPGGRGSRTVASYDEDTTTMGVEAARLAVRPGGSVPEQLLFSTPSRDLTDSGYPSGNHGSNPRRYLRDPDRPGRGHGRTGLG